MTIVRNVTSNDNESPILVSAYLRKFFMNWELFAYEFCSLVGVVAFFRVIVIYYRATDAATRLIKVEMRVADNFIARRAFWAFPGEDFNRAWSFHGNPTMASWDFWPWRWRGVGFLFREASFSPTRQLHLSASFYD